MRARKLAALFAVGALALTACGGSDDSSSESTAAAGGDGCTVGVSWNNYQEERWAKWDEPAIKAAIEAAGGTYISNDAKSSAETQATNLENLISQGAKALIVLAQDGTAIKPAVASAIEAGVPVVAYDRLIEEPKALYLTFDNKGVGKMEAEEVFKRVPKGNYVIIKGSKTDANSDFLREGYEEVIGAAVAAGDIKIVSETYTDNWDPKNAQATMEQVLTAEGNKVDAVLAENDGMAGGAIAALEAQGLAGKVAVSGQDAEQAAINRVALGTQSLTVWKDARELGKAAGEAAVALCSNGDAAAISGAAPFTTPGGNSISSIFLTPLPITQDNLGDVIDAGWTTKENVCQGVTAGSVAACP
ncbi:MAG: substrate-binding domain-containing protein [Acidimicrobiales bacterium]